MCVFFTEQRRVISIRNKAFAIESIAVMFVLIIFAFTVFVVIDAGSSAFDNIVGEKRLAETARVAYSYINTKVRQNDAVSRIDVADTGFGKALQIAFEDGEYLTYIFFSDGALYECIAKKDVADQGGRQ